MAIKAQVWEAFGAATGTSEATYAKMDRALLTAGFSFRGGFGGGRNSVHADAHYLAHLIIGTSYPLPSQAHVVVSEAYQCVRLARSAEHIDIETGPSNTIRRTATWEVEPAAVGGRTLPSYIVSWIEEYASFEAEYRDVLLHEPRSKRSKIRFDFDPLSARFEIETFDGGVVTHSFRQKEEVEALQGTLPLGPLLDRDQVIAPIGRSGFVSHSLLIVAGGLLADSWSHRNEGLPFSGQGEVQTSAPSKTEATGLPEPVETSLNEKTPDLPGSGAFKTSSQTPRGALTGQSDTPENMRVCAFKQVRTHLRGSSPSLETSHDAPSI